MTGMKHRTGWLSAGALLFSLGVCVAAADSQVAPHSGLTIHYINNSSCRLTLLPGTAYYRDKDSERNPYKQYEEQIRAPQTREKYLQYCTGKVIEPGTTYRDVFMPTGEQLDLLCGATDESKKGVIPSGGTSTEDIPYVEVPGGRDTYQRGVLSLRTRKMGKTELLVGNSRRPNAIWKDSSGNDVDLLFRVCVDSAQAGTDEDNPASKQPETDKDNPVSEKPGTDQDDPEGDSESVEIRCCSDFLPDSLLKLVVPRAELIRLAGYTPPRKPPASGIEALKNLDSFKNCISNHPTLKKEGDTFGTGKTSLPFLSEDGEELMKIKAVYVEIKDEP